MITETLRRAAALMRERSTKASWHPAVALAVADWLDEVATKEAGRESVGSVSAVVGIEHAVAVARAYLGDRT